MDFDPKIKKHCISVNKFALELANILVKKGKSVNIELVNAGSLLHDIGRVITHDLTHGFFGGKIIRKMGFDSRIQRIAETHVLGGFTKKEASEMGLYPKDYLPRTLEEKICCYADKLVSGKERISLKERFHKWNKKYGKSDLLTKAYKRLLKIEKEIKLNEI